MTWAKKRLHITYAVSVSGISKWGNPCPIDKLPHSSATSANISNFIMWKIHKILMT
jgi:hypothetical protein